MIRFFKPIFQMITDNFRVSEKLGKLPYFACLICLFTCSFSLSSFYLSISIALQMAGIGGTLAGYKNMLNKVSPFTMKDVYGRFLYIP